jgi:hypothetical protein
VTASTEQRTHGDTNIAAANHVDAGIIDKCRCVAAG